MNELNTLLIMLSPLLLGLVIIAFLMMLDTVQNIVESDFIASMKQAKTDRLVKQAEFSLWQYQRSARNVKAYKLARFNVAIGAMK